MWIAEEDEEDEYGEAVTHQSASKQCKKCNVEKAGRCEWLCFVTKPKEDYMRGFAVPSTCGGGKIFRVQKDISHWEHVAIKGLRCYNPRGL